MRKYWEDKFDLSAGGNCDHDSNRAMDQVMNSCRCAVSISGRVSSTDRHTEAASLVGPVSCIHDLHVCTMFITRVDFPFVDSNPAELSIEQMSNGIRQRAANQRSNTYVVSQLSWSSLS